MAEDMKPYQLREIIRAIGVVTGAEDPDAFAASVKAELDRRQDATALEARSDEALIAAYTAAMPDGENTPEADRIAAEMERRNLAF